MEIECTILPDGNLEVIGRLWFFAGYMLRDPLDEIVETGETVFTLAREG